MERILEVFTVSVNWPYAKWETDKEGREGGERRVDEAT